MVALGLLLSIGWGSLFESMKLISIADAVLLNYMAPVFAAILSPILLKERFEKMTVVTLVLCLLGTIAICYQSNTQRGSLNPTGVLLGLVSGLTYAFFIMLSKKTVAENSSIAVAFYSYLVCAAALLPASRGISIPGSYYWALLALLGIFNTAFAVTLYLRGLSKIKVQKAVVLSYLEPASAAVFGAIFLGQQITLQTVIGGSTIFAAGLLVTTHRRSV
ncbi:MAG: DMT family transporter [Thermoproteota archaeon]